VGQIWKPIDSDNISPRYFDLPRTIGDAENSLSRDFHALLGSQVSDDDTAGFDDAGFLSYLDGETGPGQLVTWGKSTRWGNCGGTTDPFSYVGDVMYGPHSATSSLRIGDKVVPA
jgi:hypothetical protein